MSVMLMNGSRAVFTLGIVLLVVAMAVHMGPVAARRPPPRPAVPDTTVVMKDCGPDQIPQNSQFWGHLGSLLSQLAENAPYQIPQTNVYEFKTRAGGVQEPAFGEATCNHKLSVADCQKCLTKLRDDIWGQCNSALQAHVEYVDCGIQYSDEYF